MLGCSNFLCVSIFVFNFNIIGTYILNAFPYAFSMGLIYAAYLFSLMYAFIGDFYRSFVIVTYSGICGSIVIDFLFGIIL